MQKINPVKEECIKRMKLLKLDKKIINDFSKLDKIYISDINTGYSQINEKIEKLIQDYEKDYKIKIYHVIQNSSQHNNTLFFLYVNCNPNEWKNEKRDIADGFIDALIYKVIITRTIFKQKRTIGINMDNGKICKIVYN